MKEKKQGEQQIAGGTVLLAERAQRYLLAILLLLLPYHTMVTYMFGEIVPVIRFWKEGVIGVMVLLFCFQEFKRWRREKTWYRPNTFEWIFISFLAIELVYIVMSEQLYQAAYIGRLYLMPVLLIPIVKNMVFSREYLKKLLMLVMANTAALCAWGMVQCLLLGDDFLMKLGYPTNDRWGPVQLSDGFYIAKLGDFQRLVSTFAAPNTCGLYLALVLIIILFTYKKLEIPRLFACSVITLITAALLLTFSRTSWIAAGVALVLYGCYEIQWSKKKVIFLLKTAGWIVLAAALMDGIFNAFDVTIAFIHLFVSTVNGSDTSAMGHIDSVFESIIMIAQNPFGLGMGENGPRAAMFMEEPNLTESAYFLMMYEVGILGAVVYFGGYVKGLLDNLKRFTRLGKRKDKKGEQQENKKTEISYLFVSGAILVIMTGFLSLPYIQDFEILVYIFVVMALSYNKNVFPTKAVE